MYCEQWEQNKSINPVTGRKIKVNGPTYKKMEKRCERLQCWNDEDPISFDNLKEKKPDEIIMIGKGNKKHCFLVEGLYNYYKNQTESNLPVRNPVDSSSRLTELEVKSLIKKMKKINPDTPSLIKKRKKSLYTLRYQEDFHQISDVGLVGFFIIYLWKKNKSIFIGTIPSSIEIKHTGSTDLTSATILKRLFELHDDNRLLFRESPLSCCNIHFRFSPQDWFDGNRLKLERFKNLAYEIDQLL